LSVDTITVVLMMVRRALLAPLAFVAAVVTLTIAAAPALADPTSDAATALATKSLYVDPSATIDGHKITVDSDKVTAAFGSYVKVAILPTGTSTETAVSTIARSMTGNFALAVFAGDKLDAGSTNLESGYALKSLEAAAKDHSTQLHDGNYTDALVAWANDVNSAPKGSNSNNGSNNGNQGQATSSDTSSGSAWPWLAGLGGLVVLGGGGYALSRRRKAERALSAAKANVMPYYDRLASDVNTLNPGDNATARQAMSDASERYTSAGSQMSTATTVAQWGAVRRTALEGLQAAQTAREALGLPKGPELPPIDEPRGEQLTQAQQVTVQGQQFQGYPSYTPGAPYYYGGGGGYAGGWYNSPFWETLLIGSVIGGGGWGWGGGGGGYGAGYDNGYQAGENNGNDSNANDSGGGGWGDFGGGGGGGFGDFGGGGGGDFGGGGGGGDGGSF
jgi:hypothetical protein